MSFLVLKLRLMVKFIHARGKDGIEKYVVIQTAERLLKHIKLHVEDQLSQCVRLQIDIYCFVILLETPNSALPQMVI